MLLKRDISKFNPRVLPKNDYLENLQEETKDSIIKFIESPKKDDNGNIIYTPDENIIYALENGEYGATSLYTQYRIFCSENEIPPYTNTKFGRQILFLVANGSIERSIIKKGCKKREYLYHWVKMYGWRVWRKGGGLVEGWWRV